MLGPEMITQSVAVIRQIRDRLRVAQDRQRHWADQHRRPLEFAVGDHVFLRISPTRGVIRFGVRGKLSPRYIGPFDILEQVGDVSYRLALPPSLREVHDIFHVSQLRWYIPDPSHILDHSELVVGTDLSYEERPVSILDQREKVLKNRDYQISSCCLGASLARGVDLGAR